jgi:Leucine-rich repeat (LRR) protein
LNCSNNQLTSLPPLPHSLRYLCCENNPLTYPPADVLKNKVQYIRDWMEKNPRSFTKSANKI